MRTREERVRDLAEDLKHDADRLSLAYYIIQLERRIDDLEDKVIKLEEWRLES